jgi:glycine betaine/choline ABC-type transport system substrate-binding protein
MENEFNPYIENGYKNRSDYLKSLSDEYDIDFDNSMRNG